MKRTLSLISAAALAAGMFAVPASAQLLNFPVSVNPHQGRSFSIAGLYGAALDEKGLFGTDKLSSYGGGARIGLGMINIAAAAMNVSATGGSEITFGLNAEFIAIKPGAGPFAASIFAGYGTTSGVGSNIPLGIGLSVAPSPQFSIWAAPYYSLFSPDGGGGSVNDIGVSGGIRASLPMGLGAGVSIEMIDRGGGSALTLGVAVAYTFAMGGGN